MTVSRRSRLVVAVVLCATLTPLVVARGIRPAFASGPTLVQTGAVITAATRTVTLTLPAASTAGNLLIATFSGWGDSSSSSGPGGWSLAIETSGSQTRRTSIWYYTNNPGGITSAQFTLGASTTWIAGQMSEWSGMDTLAPLDVSNRNNQASGTTFTNSGGATTSYNNELAVAVYQEDLSSASTATFTPGSGWTNFGNTGATSATNLYTSDYKQPIASATTPSETQTSTVSASVGWLGAIATFASVPTCTGGSLTLATSSVNFNTTLNGTNRTATTQPTFTPSDLTGSNAGWNIQVTSTQFTTGSHTLSTTAATLTSASRTATGGTCILPTNAVGYPVTVPAGAGPPAAVKIYNAAANTGEGSANVTLNFSLAIPASAFAGTYTSTWTFTIASGP